MKARPTYFLVLGLAFLLTVGCASGKRFSAQQAEIDDMKRELRVLRDRNAQLKREIDALQGRLAEMELALKQDKADLSTQMLEVSQQLEAVQNQLRDTHDRINALLERGGLPLTTAAPTPQASPTDTTGTATQPARAYGLDESREVYNTAYRDVLRGNYQLALEGFRQFIQTYPTSDLADNAQYWIGEVYYAQGRYADAIQEFENVVRQYKNSDKIPAALLKIGYSYLKLNETEQGKLYLEEVVRDYPDSQEANLARGRLSALK